MPRPRFFGAPKTSMLPTKIQQTPQTTKQMSKKQQDYDAYFEVVKQRVKHYEEDMDTIITKVTHLKIARECRHTSAMGRLLQAFRVKDYEYITGHLLYTTLRSSRALSDLMRCTKNYIEYLPPQREITIRHCILSNSEEHYLVTARSQKRLSTLLELQMSLCNDELTVRASAPDHLWLSLSLL